MSRSGRLRMVIFRDREAVHPRGHRTRVPGWEDGVDEAGRWVMTVPEAVAYLRETPASSMSPALTEVIERWADVLPIEAHAALIAPAVEALANGSTGRDDDEAHRWRLLDWHLRVATPAWLSLVPDLAACRRLLSSLPPAVGQDSAHALLREQIGAEQYLQRWIERRDPFLNRGDFLGDIQAVAQSGFVVTRSLFNGRGRVLTPPGYSMPGFGGANVGPQAAAYGAVMAHRAAVPALVRWVGDDWPFAARARARAWAPIVQSLQQSLHRLICDLASGA